MYLGASSEMSSVDDQNMESLTLEQIKLTNSRLDINPHSPIEESLSPKKCSVKKTLSRQMVLP